MKLTYVILLSLIISFSSCGQNQKEALEKHEQLVQAGRTKRVTELQLELQRIPGMIDRAHENIASINEFQFGRSQSTKDQQLREARAQLNEIEKYSERLVNEISKLQLSETFDFQKTPEGVMNHIFSAAKSGDFSKFRYLCDPYAENGGNSNSICLMEVLNDKSRKTLKEDFENGRTMGEPIIEGDKARIEYAYGASSNRLNEMTLINRNGLWYVFSL